MLIEQRLSGLKSETFLGIVISNRPGPSTCLIKFMVIMVRYLPKQESYASLLNCRNFIELVSRNPTPTANAIAEVGHKQGIINFQVFTFRN